MPGPRRAKSSGSQPNSCISGARNREGSATREVITTRGALPQRLDDRLGAEVGLGRDHVAAQGLHRPAVLEDGGAEAEHPLADHAAGDGGDLHPARAEPAQPLRDALRRALRVDPALVADDPGAALEAAGQHGPHPVVEVGVVSREVRIAPLADLRGGDGRLRHGLEAEVVEIAPLRVEPRGLDAIAPPRRPSPDAQPASAWSVPPRRLRAPAPRRRPLLDPDVARPRRARHFLRSRFARAPRIRPLLDPACRRHRPSFPLFSGWRRVRAGVSLTSGSRRMAAFDLGAPGAPRRPAAACSPARAARTTPPPRSRPGRSRRPSAPRAGRASARGVVTASARTCPPRMWPAEEGRLSTPSGTTPPIRSVSIGPAPR